MKQNRLEKSRRFFMKIFLRDILEAGGIDMWTVLTVCVLAMILFYVTDDSIVITKSTIHSRKVNSSVKCAVVSDFHCGDAEQVIEILNEENPDLVLIPGDILDENKNLESVIVLLCGLQKWKSYYVSGNHEYKTGRHHKSYEELKLVLERYGIVCLQNESKEVFVRTDKIWIGGVADHCSEKSVKPDVMDQRNLECACRSLNSDLFTILLMHRPEQYRLTEKFPIDLLISGHAHGGQWRLPGINGLFAPQQGFFPKRAGGLYPLKHGVHLVSRGLAKYWFLPRICNHREVNIIQIEKAD